ncbi:MAG TPA: serine/threonine-protein kinase, partial [Polyangiaceae bacterium]
SGRPYLVMEHLDGIDLGALIARDGPLSVEVAVDYALQICEPLAEAHALGIVHRDIKPENLFLWSGGPGKDIVKVLDFGLAKQFGGQRAITMTGPQDSIGSPCYMSPEQITTPQSIDCRTDIWSLGVVLHHLLTDALPFEGQSIIEVLSHVLSAAPKSLQAALPGRQFDPALDAIVTRCLEKKAEARYQTMADLATALGDYLSARREAAVLNGLAMQQPGASLESPPFVSGSEPRVLEDDQDAGKLRIPGVHARWPGVLLCTLGLAAAALFLAQRTGNMRVQNFAAGWLYPARLGADVPLPPRADHERSQPIIARGIYATEPTRELNGALALRAVPEVNAEGSAQADSGATPISEPERARREAEYRAYLRRQSLIPLPEGRSPTEAPATTPGQEPIKEPANARPAEPPTPAVDATPDPRPTPPPAE